MNEHIEQDKSTDPIGRIHECTTVILRAYELTGDPKWLEQATINTDFLRQLADDYEADIKIVLGSN